jgi:hypothetical protein
MPLFGTLHGYGANFWVVLLVLAIIVPPAFVRWREHGFRYSLRSCLVAMVVLSAGLAFAHRDIAHLPQAWFFHRGVLLPFLLIVLPGAVLAKLSIAVYQYLTHRGENARADRT